MTQIDLELIETAKQNSFGEAKRLIYQRADVNVKDKDGGTAFLLADRGRAEIVTVLKQAGARE